MQTSIKSDVIWSPVHNDNFVVWSSESNKVMLYEVANLEEIENTANYVQISSTRGATVVASQSANGVRCLDISSIPELPEPLLAFGHSTGHVSLTSLKQAYDPLGLTGREFVPRYPRPCSSVSWNPVETNLLASGLEKHRSDHSILIWDVNRAPSTVEEAKEGGGPTSDGAKPIAEMGLSETCNHVSWANHNRTLLACMNMKFIKIFDLRDWAHKAVASSPARLQLAAAAEPGGWRVGSRGDAVCVWDARALTKPLLVAAAAAPPVKIQWCPTRSNVLMSLQRDSSVLRLHDIQQAQRDPPPAPPAPATPADPAASSSSSSAPESEQYSGCSSVERDVSVGPAAVLAAFCWHPRRRAALLVLGATGTLAECEVLERAALCWGARGVVWGARGLARATRALCADDISHAMRRRAALDYGLKPDLWQNADLAGDEALSAMWHFLALSKSLVEDGCMGNTSLKHPGVRSLLRAPGDGGYRSESVQSLLPDLPNKRVTIYRSVERSRALQLCGWGWGWDSAGCGVERAEAEGTPCRAAALAAFHLRLRGALAVLQAARDPLLRVVGLALAGLSEERLWRECVPPAAQALPDPYLRALLHFLVQPAPAPDQPHPVLEETEMRLEDRVAFACMYLSDAALSEYVRVTCDALVEQGDLSAMLLTGVSPQGMTLLQRYLDRTGDVQTCALVSVRCAAPAMLQELWLASYRSLLDSWQLWGARCALDTCAGAATDDLAAPRQVTVACTYCGKSIAPPQRRAKPPLRLPPPAAKMKITACPNCRKPLPRCGVCSLHLGAGGAGGGAPHWFAWCAACRHAGHAQHLHEWFLEHNECPVSSCNCPCASLDPPDRLPNS